MKKDPQHYWAQTYIGEKRVGSVNLNSRLWGEQNTKLEKALTTGAIQNKGVKIVKLTLVKKDETNLTKSCIETKGKD